MKRFFERIKEDYFNKENLILLIIVIVFIAFFLVYLKLSDLIYEYIVYNKESFHIILALFIGVTIGITYYLTKERYKKKYENIFYYSFSFPNGKVKGVLLGMDSEKGALYFYQNGAESDDELPIIHISDISLENREKLLKTIKKYDDILSGLNYQYEHSKYSRYYSSHVYNKIEIRDDIPYEEFFSKRERLSKMKEANELED